MLANPKACGCHRFSAREVFGSLRLLHYSFRHEAGHKYCDLHTANPKITETSDEAWSKGGCCLIFWTRSIVSLTLLQVLYLNFVP